MSAPDDTTPPAVPPMPKACAGFRCSLPQCSGEAVGYHGGCNWDHHACANCGQPFSAHPAPVTQLNATISNPNLCVHGVHVRERCEKCDPVPQAQEKLPEMPPDPVRMSAYGSGTMVCDEAGGLCSLDAYRTLRRTALAYRDALAAKERKCERLKRLFDMNDADLRAVIARAEAAERAAAEAVRLLKRASDGLDECWVEDCRDGREFVRDRDALFAALAKEAK